VSALAVVQARMSSTRRPGKVLADIDGDPMLALVLRRLGRARSLSVITVATSVEPVDDAVAELAEAEGARVVRGPLDDVLGRYLLAIEGYDGAVVRITADCPLIDPEVVDRVVEALEADDSLAYASNIDPRSFPQGLDTEVFRAAALRELAEIAGEQPEREHVTLGFRSRRNEFPQVAVTGDRDLGDLRWTVDTPEDLEFVRALVPRLGEERYSAGLDAILAAVTASPSLAGMPGGRRA
jgi:spore coat polysaccharide biosynthesis protein SpsF (cytidylyltransferase family)